MAERRSGHRRRAITLLAATLFLLAAASFHASDDNDIASLPSGAPRAASISRPAAPDTCPACALDGILLAQLSVALPLDRPSAVEPLAVGNPPSPFVSPRASVESRPPPSIG